MAEDFELTGEHAIQTDNERRSAEAAKHRLRTIDVMHRRYGVAPEGVVCGGCVHLVRSGGGDSHFPKCKQFRISCSAATDWRLRWRACGKYTAREVSYEP